SQHRAEEKFVVHRNTKPGVMFADLLKHRATDKCPLMEKTGLETQPGIASAWLQYSPLIAGTEENRESDDIRAGSGQRLVDPGKTVIGHELVVGVKKNDPFSPGLANSLVHCIADPPILLRYPVTKVA